VREELDPFKVRVPAGRDGHPSAEWSVVCTPPGGLVGFLCHAGGPAGRLVQVGRSHQRRSGFRHSANQVWWDGVVLNTGFGWVVAGESLAEFGSTGGGKCRSLRFVNRVGVAVTVVVMEILLKVQQVAADVVVVLGLLSQLLLDVSRCVPVFCVEST
jgi:hypothetical protein